jgi:uncharacterized protein YndB with AHSA1/START domain
MFFPGLAAGEIAAADDHHFTVSHSVTTPAEPYVVYRTMTAHIDQWWSGDHSWSGDAANLYMAVEQGGCFCEKLPDGGRVEHLRLIYFSPGTELRFDGALGPLQTMAVQGRMTWRIEPAEAGSTVRFTYRVFGHAEGGLSGMAPSVDRVIGEQLSSLADRLSRD